MVTTDSIHLCGGPPRAEATPSLWYTHTHTHTHTPGERGGVGCSSTHHNVCLDDVWCDHRSVALHTNNIHVQDRARLVKWKVYAKLNIKVDSARWTADKS